jgi:hypothetical protein
VTKARAACEPVHVIGDIAQYDDHVGVLSPVLWIAAEHESREPGKISAKKRLSSVLFLVSYSWPVISDDE